jgi:hypothetical protein
VQGHKNKRKNVPIGLILEGQWMLSSQALGGSELLQGSDSTTVLPTLLGVGVVRQVSQKQLVTANVAADIIFCPIRYLGI